MIKYCRQDVLLLRKLFFKLKPYVFEWARVQKKNYQMIERMNARGVPIDSESAFAAVKLLSRTGDTLYNECVELCGSTPGQVAELTEWLGLDNLQKATLEAILDDPAKRDQYTVEAQRVMYIRLEVARASVKKLVKMIELSEYDGFAHDCFISNGAHTGRLTSIKIQLQNMYRGTAPPEYWKKLIRGAHKIEDPFGETAEAMRGFIKAKPGYKIMISDLSQIEARVLACMAGESWLIEAFKSHEDPYLIMAAAMFNIVNRRTLTKASPERQAGKVVELAAGYQLGGVGLQHQFHTYKIYDYDLKKCWSFIFQYRRRHEAIVAWWAEVHGAFMKLADDKTCSYITVTGGLIMKWSAGKVWIEIMLPDGFTLRYLLPRTFWGTREVPVDWKDPEGPQKKIKVKKVDYLRVRKSGHMYREETWGGKLVENIVQAVAARIMLHGGRNAEMLGFPLIMSVHDEWVAHVPDWMATQEWLDTFNEALCSPQSWYESWPIEAEGEITERYKK
jgi:DNA polymerase